MSKTPTNYNTVHLHVTLVAITCYCGFVLLSFVFFLPAFGVQWKLDLEGISSSVHDCITVKLVFVRVIIRIFPFTGTE